MDSGSHLILPSQTNETPNNDQHSNDHQSNSYIMTDDHH